MERIKLPVQIYKSSLKNIGNSFTQAISGYTKFSNSFREAFRPLKKDWSKVLEPLMEAAKPFHALAVVSDNQYVVWAKFSKNDIDRIILSENINTTLRKQNEKGRYKEAIEIARKCSNHILMKSNKRLFEQAIDSFMEGKTDLAATGITATIDGVLAIASKNDNTNIGKRINPLIDKINKSEDISESEYSLFALTYSMSKMTDSLSARSDFAGKEPKLLNRHWIMHGRATRRKTKLDCVKLIRYLYGILLINDLLNDTDG